MEYNEKRSDERESMIAILAYNIRAYIYDMVSCGVDKIDYHIKVSCEIHRMSNMSKEEKNEVDCGM